MSTTETLRKIAFLILEEQGEATNDWYHQKLNAEAKVKTLERLVTSLAGALRKSTSLGDYPIIWDSVEALGLANRRGPR